MEMNDEIPGLDFAHPHGAYENTTSSWPHKIPQALSGTEIYAPFDKIQKEFDLINKRLAALEARLPMLKEKEDE